MGKKITILSLLVCFLFLTGCFPLTGATTPAPSLTPVVITEAPIPTAIPPVEQSGLSDDLLRNSSYLSPQAQGGITLVDGRFSGQVNGIELTSVMYPQILHGDINGDGVQDAAFLLSEDTGGSGVFVSLIVVYSQNGEFTQSPGYFIEDRPIINSFEFANGEILLEANVHAPNDPMVNPTLAAVFEFDLFDQAVVLTHLTTAAGEGRIRSIEISSPLEGQTVSSPVTINGSMPIGPFENNLSFRILDLNGQQLFQSGFIVQAEDMGAPATFDNPIDLAALTFGSEYILELSELSMADGRPLAIDTVLVSY